MSFSNAAGHRYIDIFIRVFLASLLLFAAGTAAAEQRLDGLATPESAIVGPDGRIFVSEIGAFGKDGDGRVAAIGASNKAEPFASGLDDPKGLAASGDAIFVSDKTRIWKIDMQGKASVFVTADAFPQPPVFLNDLAFDSKGNLFVSDTGDLEKGGKGAIFMVMPDGAVSLVVSEAQNPAVKSPNGLLAESDNKMLVVDFATGELLRLDLAKGSTEKIADGFGGGDGLARDAAGVLYISDWKNGKLWKLDLAKSGAKPEAYDRKFQASADITLSSDGASILVPDMKAGALIWLPK